MGDCDKSFLHYFKLLSDSMCTPRDIAVSYEHYQSKRNMLNKRLVEKYDNDYRSVINSHDDQKLWNLIDWSGEMNKSTPKLPPSINEMSELFTELYEPMQNDGDVDSLESNVYMPVTDDPITIDEIYTSANQMKKGDTITP